MVATSGTLTPFAEGVWYITVPVRILGTQLTATMTVLRLGNGSLLIHSPVTLTEELRAAIGELGPVAHLYAPNLYHHLKIGDWAAAFPTACLHAPAGLARKRPDLRIDRTHDSVLEPALAETVDEYHIDGFRLGESVLMYRPSRTLVVADLVHNIGHPHHLWTRIYTGMMGFYGRVALSRMIRWTAFSDRAAARRSLDTLLALQFDGLIVGHGAPLKAGAREAIAGAYTWLLATSR